MSRPPSIETLLAQAQNDNGKPKFVLKLLRNKLKDQQKAPAPKRQPFGRTQNPPKTTPENDHDPKSTPQPSQTPPNVSSGPPSKKQKFSFDWDERDDTSADYAPLVSYQTKNDDIVAEVHWSSKKLGEMTERDWRLLRTEFNIVAKNINLRPVRRWNEAEVNDRITSIITRKLHYADPTPVQRAAIPIAVAQRDLVAVAETGSGKTIAFLVPILNYILSVDQHYLSVEHKQPINKNRPLALILAPTRELALQIGREIEKFAPALGLNSVSVIGGHQYEETVSSIGDGVHIVVATPGRLVDSVERGILRLDKCYYVAMDEADKMIDMGFEKLVQSILAQVPTSNVVDTKLRVHRRTTMMFTATITPEIEKITSQYLENAARITVGNPNELLDNITQHFDYGKTISGDLDPSRLAKIADQVRKHSRGLVIVFANFKRTCELIAETLENGGYKVGVIHGLKSQELREAAIAGFRAHETRVLVATDVAARGIDVPNVSLVINYQMPNKFEEYIHRIGRTGRAGKTGESYSFVDDNDRESFVPLKKFLSQGGKRCPEWLYKSVAQSITE